MTTDETQAVDDDGRMSTYREALLLIERLHRRFLDVLKAEIDRTGRADVNNVQALILYNIGDDEITVGELTNRGYYLGSNVSYNVKQLTNNGYIEQERSPHDRRSVRVKLSDKGRALRGDVTALFERHVAGLLDGDTISLDDIVELNVKLRRIERFWSEQVQFRG
ncbi:MAG: MarR family winged helix-turn-helix transcriptional regulator [Alphaproteobacteria bacterium]|jgi:DNA-binding MarR family transcriptional regulator|nr:MarR family winged helix-turn-helix transcriptional regulator [Alphaproteobacteria bacterium]